MNGGIMNISTHGGDTMTIGERVKHRRLELGLSAEDVAEALGKNRATVYRYESNDIEKLPTTVLEPLAMVLRTTPAYLMGWTDDPVHAQPAQKETPSADSERWDRFRQQYEELSAEEQHRIDAVLDALLPEAGQDQ